MPRMTVRLMDWKFMRNALVGDVQEVARGIAYGGAYAFAVDAERKIPVWTGMAKGGLLGKVQRFDGRIVTAKTALGLEDSPEIVDISSARSARRAGGARIFTKSGRLPRLGSGEIKNKYAGMKRAGYIFKQTPQKITVDFYHDIPQWKIHEDGTGTSPTAPWHAIEVGKKSFTAYVNKYAKQSFDKIKIINYFAERVVTEKTKTRYKDVKKVERQRVRDSFKQRQNERAFWAGKDEVSAHDYLKDLFGVEG